VPTKTDRILSYLPSTFRPLPRPTAIYSLTDAFGGELQGAENSLAAVMQSHWVDHADRFEELFQDLPQFAALYGLAPRDDEEIEEFRAHLKRYVRTFIEGTVTVQGILRIAADALGLLIADAEDELDAWWTRPDETLTTTRPRLDDAAAIVFGTGEARVSGADARTAAVTGTRDLSDGVDVRDAPNLSVAIDGAAPVVVDLGTLADPGAVTAADAVPAINGGVGAAVASDVGGRLRLASPTVGAASGVSVADVDGDAATLLLGLKPRRARGRAAAAAVLAGAVDLSAGVDLDPPRYVRVRVDGAHEAEIDLRGGGPVHASADDLRTRVNDALGLDVAAVEDDRLILRSPTQGATSSIELAAPAAQDATRLVFGDTPRFVAGEDAQPARLAGRDVSAGLDLRDRSKLAVAVDGAEAVTVDCTGADPAGTRPGEVVERLNAELGPVAGYDGHSITLSSLTSGPDSTIAVETPDGGDATETILGIGPRSFSGADAIDARLEGPAAPVDLRAEHVVRIALDGGAPRDVDLRAHAAEAGAVTATELAQALDDAFGRPVAAVESGRLVMSSPTHGGAGSVALEPLDETLVRRFVTRALVRGEAAEKLLGVLEAEASGTAPAAAVIEGQADLSHAVDLRESGYLGIAVDGGPAHDVSVAGVRPRATTLVEVVAKINGALGQVAHAVEGRLELRSRTLGSASRIVLSAPTPEDALHVVGLAPGTVHGSDAVRVSFLSTVDLSDDVDLSSAPAVRLKVDGNEQQVGCAGSDPANTTIDEIVDAINGAFDARVAIIEGPRIRLRSQTAGAAGTLEFLEPVAAGDATGAIFGIEPPRSYHGNDAQPGRVVGAADLAGGLTLGPPRFLRVAVDADRAVSVDLGASAADPEKPTLDEAVAALTAALRPGVASRDDGHLVLTSPTLGAGGRLTLEPHASRDARTTLLGRDVPAEAQGSDGEPATITGTVDLLQPVDLSARGTLVLSFDGGPPVEIEVAGAMPVTTFLDEVVTAINARFPGLAEATDDDRLGLHWSGARLAVLPARVLEVVEYPPEQVTEQPVRLHHGQTWGIDDDGAAEAEADIELVAIRGIATPGIVNVAAALELRLLTAVGAGGRISVRPLDGARVEATVISPGGLSAPVPPEAILVVPLGPGAGGTDPLRIPQGRSDWRYLECIGTRFDRAHFDVDSFSGGPCTEVGVFDASRWGTVAEASVSAVFGDAAAPAEASVDVSTRWTRHAPGSFAVNLPAELPARFGARFNDGRFGSGEDQVERYPDAVSEPENDPHDLAHLLDGSHLVAAKHVDTVPLGWSPVRLPFRRPQRLTIGVPGSPAALYLQEEEVPGFIEVQAREDGPQGTAIVVTAPRSGPAQFDVTVSFEAGRFEVARQIVAGRPLSASADDLLRAGPIGVLEAKAAGLRATVMRERTVSATRKDDNP
jgi:hypothetical protein